MFGGRLPNRECLNFESSGCAVISGEVAAHSFWGRIARRTGSDIHADSVGEILARLG